MCSDIEKYRQYVDQFDLPEQEKVELINIVWRVMESFVDRAFNDDPVQHVQAIPRAKDALASDDVLD